MSEEPPIGCKMCCVFIILAILGLLALLGNLWILAIITWACIPILIISFYIIDKKRWGFIKRKK